MVITLYDNEVRAVLQKHVSEKYNLRIEETYFIVNEESGTFEAVELVVAEDE